MTDTPPPGGTSRPPGPGEGDAPDQQPDQQPDQPQQPGRSWRQPWSGWPSKSAGLPRPRRTGPRRLVPTWRMVLGGSLVAIALSFAAVLAGYLLVDVPQPKSTAAAQNNVFLYADGSQLARVGEINREIVPLDEVPGHVRRAVLAAEDRDFYDSDAVDLASMVRAAWNMVRGEGRQSGSTITQQYVKNYYLDQEQTITRKVRELFIAVKLDQEVSKDEILEGYLNTSYFGRNAYGIQAAAQAYYGKDASALTTAEGAYLAALLNAPSAYDVRAVTGNRGAAVARWEYVLDGMVSEGWLRASARKPMRFPEPRPLTPTADLSGQRGYLVEAAKSYLLEHDVVDERALARGGLKITTTIQPDRQRALTEAVEGQLLDTLSPERRAADSYVRAGAASVDADTGRVVAMYGGVDYTQQYVNNATRRDYQAASTFKPIVYAAALQHHAVTHKGAPIGPDTKYDGTSGREVVRRDGKGTGWAPHNQGLGSYGKLTVAEAMDKSVNAVFAQLGQDVGAKRVRDTAVALGIPESAPGLEAAEGSIALGTVTASPLDLAQAYATLAAHGMRHPVVLVERVTRDGRELPLPEPEPERAISRMAADGTTAVLRGVVEAGTGVAARTAGRPAAGKTGTAEEDRAAWFAGYTPELATVIAIFGQDPATGAQRALYGAAGLERISGGGFPAAIWGQYTAAALHGEPVAEFQLKGPRPTLTREQLKLREERERAEREKEEKQEKEARERAGRLAREESEARREEGGGAGAGEPEVGPTPGDASRSAGPATAPPPTSRAPSPPAASGSSSASASVSASASRAAPASPPATLPPSSAPSSASAPSEAEPVVPAPGPPPESSPPAPTAPEGLRTGLPESVEDEAEEEGES